MQHIPMSTLELEILMAHTRPVDRADEPQLHPPLAAAEHLRALVIRPRRHDADRTAKHGSVVAEVCTQQGSGIFQKIIPRISKIPK